MQQPYNTSVKCGLNAFKSSNMLLRRNREPRVCVVYPGTIRVFRTALELRKRGLLDKCITSLYIPPWITKALPNRGPLGYLRRMVEVKLANRQCPELSGTVVQWPWPELVCLTFSRLGIGNANAWIRWRNDRFGRWAAQHALDGVDIAYGFDTASLHIFQEARRRGIRCLLDMTIAHPCESERILREHALRRPEYAADLGEYVKSKEEINSRVKEMELADVIIASSEFIKRSLERFGIPSDKILSNPLGVDLERFRPSQKHGVNYPVRFLFVGWFSQRKGVYYALEAWERANLSSKAELWLVGGSKEQLRCWDGRLPEGVRLLGRVPYSELPEIFRKAHVFVFPSLVEGFAKVTLEAMASGLPIMGTDHLLEGIVENEIEGILLGAGDIEALAQAMRDLVNSPSLIKRMGIAARRRAEDYTWTAHGDRCAEICRSLA